MFCFAAKSIKHVVEYKIHYEKIEYITNFPVRDQENG